MRGEMNDLVRCARAGLTSYGDTRAAFCKPEIELCPDCNRQCRAGCFTLPAETCGQVKCAASSLVEAGGRARRAQPGGAVHKAALAGVLPPPARVLKPLRCPEILLINPLKVVIGGQGEKEVKRGQETCGERKGVGGATVGFKFYLFFLTAASLLGSHNQSIQDSLSLMRFGRLLPGLGRF